MALSRGESALNGFRCLLWGFVGASLFFSASALIEWYPRRVIMDLKVGDIIGYYTCNGCNYRCLIVTEDRQIRANQFPKDDLLPLAYIKAIQLKKNHNDKTDSIFISSDDEPYCYIWSSARIVGKIDWGGWEVR